MIEGDIMNDKAREQHLMANTIWDAIFAAENADVSTVDIKAALLRIADKVSDMERSVVEE